MDNPTQEHIDPAFAERRRVVAYWITDKIRPAAIALAELSAAGEENAQPFELRDHQLDAWGQYLGCPASGPGAGAPALGNRPWQNLCCRG